MTLAQKKRLLDDLYVSYNRPEFIHPDPLEFLHHYPHALDREIVGIIASSLAYGRVAQILKSIRCILEVMAPSPRVFLEGASKAQLENGLSCFKHRFTTGEEIIDFLLAIKSVIETHGSLERSFLNFYKPRDRDITRSLEGFVNGIRQYLSQKESSLLPCPEKHSACKRLHLFLRWMVRKDDVDPGGWDYIAPSKLIVPLDVHMHRIGLALELTNRRQADLKTACEITESFRGIMPDDPVRYDFSLTRIGIRNDIDMNVIMNYKEAIKNEYNPTRGVCYG